MAVNRVAAIFICIALSACTTASDRQVRAAEPGDSVTLAPGEAVSVKKAGMTVRFLSVVTDSRCPRDAACFWAGEVRVQLEIRETSREPALVELREGESTAAGRFRVTLLRVDPQPVSTTKIAPQDYRATLAVNEGA